MKIKKSADGFALITTLLILVILSIVVVGVYQNSILGILVSQNAGDQPEALNGAASCEQHMVRRVLNMTFSQYSLNPVGIKCTSSTPTVISKNNKIAGASASLMTQDVRFQTDSEGRRNSHITLLTDVSLVFNKPN